MLYPMVRKKFWTGPQPGSSVPDRVMTRESRQKMSHSKEIYARNTTVGHSSKSVKYEPSYENLKIGSHKPIGKKI